MLAPSPKNAGRNHLSSPWLGVANGAQQEGGKEAPGLQKKKRPLSFKSQLSGTARLGVECYKTDGLGEKIKRDSEDTGASARFYTTLIRRTKRSPPQESITGGGGGLTSLPFGAPFMSGSGPGAGLVGALAPLAVCEIQKPIRHKTPRPRAREGARERERERKREARREGERRDTYTLDPS